MLKMKFPKSLGLNATAAALIPAFFIASCSADPTTPAQAPASTVAATTTVWADVAGLVLDSEVPAMISNPATDPHDFEPAASDLAVAAQASLLVANGGTYDAALYRAAEPDRVISALPLAEGHEHDHDHEHDHEHEGNEHVWYDTTAVRQVADKLAQAAEKDGITADPTRVTERLDAVDDKLHALPAARIAQTHPIADAIVANTALDEVTPESYRHATLNHSEPSSAAVAELISLIETGQVDVLIDNPQTPSSLSERIQAAAEEAGVAVVKIAETPQNGQDFFDYFDEIAATLTQTLSTHT